MTGHVLIVDRDPARRAAMAPPPPPPEPVEIVPHVALPTLEEIEAIREQARSIAPSSSA